MPLSGANSTVPTVGDRAIADGCPMIERMFVRDHDPRDHEVRPHDVQRHGTLDWLGELNERQREAVTASRDRPLLILAGAGSGKTATLSARGAWLIAEGVAPERILLLTFTPRAAPPVPPRA